MTDLTCFDEKLCQIAKSAKYFCVSSISTFSRVFRTFFQVSVVENGGTGNFFTNPEGDIVFELIDEQAGGKPFEVDILDQIQLKDEPIENTPQELVPEQNNMPNLTPFGSQMPSNQQQQHMGYLPNGSGNGQYLNDMKSAYVTILEQPSANKHRFR